MARAICIVGGDGTGKTAHAQRLLADLQCQGRQCRYEWFGQPYILSYPFMYLCNKLGYTKNHHLPNSVVCQEHRYYRNRAVASVWPWIQLFDLTLLVFSRVYVPVMRGVTVVCDRFVYDTLAELMADNADPKLHKKLVGKAIVGLKPKSAVVVRLNVSSKNAFERRTDVPDERFLKIRRDNYETLGHDLNLTTINAERSFEQVHQDIMQQLE
jgi:thymidylate kinase